ncbi:hypothetical protein GQ53DRAFT_36179 [Thozetella sp. PMI_491]|nr:hypothetical protein GQ53DRAFT_36179 [Thozetella sp. PMI_491]
MSASGSFRITRNRERLACSECRRRKLKCDRELPCGSCTRRGVAASCDYQSATAERTQVDNRLQRLEQLVQHLVSNPDTIKSSSSNASPESLRVSAAGPTPTSSPFEQLYSGSTHWSAMLEDIQELRLAITTLDAPEQSHEATLQLPTEGFGILFGATPAPALQDVLAQSLPPRQDTDRLIAAYFRAQAVVAPFIHTKQFQRQYTSFWGDPMAAPPLWTSMLFSICHVAANALQVGNREKERDYRFTAAAASCLAIGEYFRPKRFALQSLLLYAQSHCLTSITLPPDLGTVFSLIIRTATRMGYHKDATGSPEYSPFEIEMRRRTWSACVQLELLVSFHLGIPSVLPFGTGDTRPPRNLRDSDFDENCTELPPELSDSDFTSMLFYNTKYKFMVVFEKILHHALAVPGDSSKLAEVIALDAEIHDIYTSLPEMLRPRPISESVVDSPSLIVTRLCVSAIYCKCICVLHRPYVADQRAESVAACYRASSILVREFADVADEFGPDGQAAQERWFLSSLTWHDFLLGVTALCLVTLSTRGSHTAGLVDIFEAVAMLERARDILADQVLQRGPETGRVHSLLDATLRRLEEQGSGTISALPEATTMMGENRAGDSQDDWGYDPVMQGVIGDTLWNEQLQDILNNPHDSFVDGM